MKQKVRQQVKIKVLAGARGWWWAEILSNESLRLENDLFSISENGVLDKEPKVGETTKIFFQFTPNIENTHI